MIEIRAYMIQRPQIASEVTTKKQKVAALEPKKKKEHEHGNGKDEGKAADETSDLDTIEAKSEEVRLASDGERRPPTCRLQ